MSHLDGKQAEVTVRLDAAGVGDLDAFSTLERTDREAIIRDITEIQAQRGPNVGPRNAR